MIQLLKNELNRQRNFTTTENGAIGYKSTGKNLLDMNYKISSFRNCTEEEIIESFDKAYHENVEYAMKWLFYVRDIREGVGERRLFRVCYGRLAELNIDLFCKNLKNISYYGRWDDLIALVGLNDTADEHIIDIIREQLNSDLHNMSLDKSVSLLAKWMPSENASSKETKRLAKKVRKMLNYSSKEYRKTLSKLRKYLNVVEVKMCDNDWEHINYESVPSMANLKYSNAFMNHDRSRRMEYLESVSKGESKLNMKVASPVDVVSRYGSWGIKDYDQTLELAWKNLKDVMVEDTLVVADGSGSMTVEVSGRTSALDVANSLAIYTSEHNTGVYRNKYITFSNNPQFVEFGEDDTLETKLRIARDHNEIANTNIEKVFDLILSVAIQNDIPKDEMVKNVLIISDMEFDMAQRGWGNSDVILTQSLFDGIKQRYIGNGYNLPRLIFWNVNSRTQTIPLVENELGVVLVSGFSQNVLKMVMSNNLNPYDVLVETITSERYDQIITD